MSIRRYEKDQRFLTNETISKIADALQIPVELLVNSPEAIASMQENSGLVEALYDSICEVDSDFEKVPKSLQFELMLQFIDQNPEAIKSFLTKRIARRKLMGVEKEDASADDEILKINCAAVSSYMEKMNRAGQAVAVQTVKTLADMPEYQKKDEPGQE